MKRSPRTHTLKTEPRHFEAVLSGRKTHEVRRNDRGFEVGDRLFLEEWRSPDRPGAGKPGYTGRATVAVITHVLGALDVEGLHRDFVVLSIQSRHRVRLVRRLRREVRRLQASLLAERGKRRPYRVGVSERKSRLLRAIHAGSATVQRV